MTTVKIALGTVVVYGSFVVLQFNLRRIDCFRSVTPRFCLGIALLYTLVSIACSMGTADISRGEGGYRWPLHLGSACQLKHKIRLTRLRHNEDLQI